MLAPGFQTASLFQPGVGLLDSAGKVIPSFLYPPPKPPPFILENVSLCHFDGILAN